MPEPTDLVPRRAEALVREALEDTRVVLVNGARQAGKSTLTRLATKRQPTVVRLLDDPATLRTAKDDPSGFVEHDSLMVASWSLTRFRWFRSFSRRSRYPWIWTRLPAATS